jgi:hypothetical protein
VVETLKGFGHAGFFYARLGPKPAWFFHALERLLALPGLRTEQEDTADGPRTIG